MKEERNLSNPNENKKSILSKIPDGVKVEFFRWWFVGAICFFIAWGTDLGKNDPFDLVFVLALVISFGHILIFNPIVYGMFDIKRNGKIVNKKIGERRVWEGALMKTLDFFQCLLVSILVYGAYEGINRMIIHFSDLTGTTVPFPIEPFGYATLFLTFYLIISFIVNKLSLLISNIYRKHQERKNLESKER
ncbi:MAG: hypothetical protein K2P14_06130 [Anaeroplasmataceae bacterium]|nr:hypothetical protein [Anaeroplasmataceae bacterium]